MRCDTINMNLKNYKRIQETEKAVEVEFTYWSPTGDDKKKHHVKKIKVWVPKSCISEIGEVQYEFLSSKLSSSAKLKKALRWVSNFGDNAPSKKLYSDEWFSSEKQNKFLKRLARYISFRTGKKYNYHTIDQYYDDLNKNELFYKKCKKAGIVKSVKYTDGTLYIFARPTLNNHNSKAVYIW